MSSETADCVLANFLIRQARRRIRKALPQPKKKEGRVEPYAWLVVREAGTLVSSSAIQPRNVPRTIRRWIAQGKLLARKASKEEIALLIATGRVHGLPPEGFLYLIHRDDLAAFIHHR